MDWNQVVGFYYIAKQGSFTRAAGTLFKTQSALTHQIKSLETELGCLLFERIGKRRIRLTEAGEKFFAFSEEIIQKYNYLIDELNELKGLKKGHLKIAAPFTTLYHLLPVPLQNYTAQFPWVELTILDRAQRNVIQLVRQGDVDFGFVLESLVPKELDFRRWKKAETVLLVAKGHPLTREKQVSIEQIARYPLIMPPREAGFGHRKKLDELFSRQGLEYRVVMESSNVELSSLYCEMGLGITFATIVENLPARKKRKLAFISMSHYFDPEYIALVMRKSIDVPHYKRSFIDLLFPEFDST